MKRWPKPTGKLKPIKNFVPKFGPGITFHRDGKGLLWMKVDVPKPRERPHGPLAPRCYRHCLFYMARPHFTCLSCRIRRVLQKKIPPLQDVELYTVAIWHDRPFSRVKAFFLKRLLTLAEFFAS